MSTFEDELRALGKRRIALPALRAAYLRARPEVLNAPDGRRLLLEALQVLEHDGILELPKLPSTGWDTSGSPGLPRTASLRVTATSRPVPTPHAWLPALAFAAGERHPGRRADLQAINAFLVSARDRNVLSVPTKERSLQIFGDEKRLDRLRKGGSTLFEGRISLDDLECYPVAPPLPYEAPGRRAPGRPILVLENYHSFDSFRRWNQKQALYAAVAYGGGNAFRQGAGNLDELISRTGAGGAIYLGDVDPAGVRILVGANARRKVEGRAPLRPHGGLYRWLLAHGHRRPLETPPGDELVHRLRGVFPSDVVNAIAELWSRGKRVPQESYGLEQLDGNDAATADPDAA